MNKKELIDMAEEIRGTLHDAINTVIANIFVPLFKKYDEEVEDSERF